MDFSPKKWVGTILAADPGCLGKHMSQGVMPSAHVFQPSSLRIQYSALYLNIKHK